MKTRVIYNNPPLSVVHENVGYSLTTDEETVFLSTIASGVLETSEYN